MKSTDYKAQLFEMIIGGKGLQHVMDACSDLLGNPFVFANRSLQLVCKSSSSYETATIREGDVVRTEISIKNQQNKPYFTNNQDIRISFPVPDQYEDSQTSLVKRCHAHIFCGKNISWLCAVRMGGKAPHLGMVVTSGSLAGYSVQRNLFRQSNDRGCFYLHTEGMEFMPGETKKICWVIFPHNGKEDFLEKAGKYYKKFVHVQADRYVLYPGETCKICIQPVFQAEQVTVDGHVLIRKCSSRTNSYVYIFTAKQTGEQIIEICVDDIKTFCRIFVQEDVRTLTRKRCEFIAEHQQYQKEGLLKGAYLIYDNDEERLIYTPENDFNGGRERMGMGGLIARFLQEEGAGKFPKLENSLKQYMEYVKRELVDTRTGKVYNDAGMDDSYHRLYNLPWAATLFLEVYRLWKKEEDLMIACRIVQYFYMDGGTDFYPIQLPVLLLMEELKKKQSEKKMFGKEYDILLEMFKKHAERLCEYGENYPGSEVNYEQSIVAPAVDILLSVYILTGNKKYLEEGSRQIKILELFNGIQPDYRMNEVAIRHWDGYWFGKRRFFGDTFPHYWSATSGMVFKMYGKILKDSRWIERGEASIRGVLPLFFKNGRASCAYVYPMFVNDQKADFADPYANDQDWGLYYNLLQVGHQQ